MRQNFDESLKEVLTYEGGYVDHPRDPGGATNYGITIGTYSNYRARVFGKPETTKQNLKDITMSEVHAIYKRYYWDSIGADTMPSGYDFALFDLAVNSGAARANTWHKGIDVSNPASAIIALCNKRLSFVQGLSTWSVFGRGWARRIASVKAKAMLMAGAPYTLDAEVKEHKAKSAAQLGGAIVAIGGSGAAIQNIDMLTVSPFSVFAFWAITTLLMAFLVWVSRQNKVVADTMQQVIDKVRGDDHVGVG
jgi:lysozyme family protein